MLLLKRLKRPKAAQKKTKFPDSISTAGFNALAVVYILAFGVLAWLAKGTVERHIPLSAVGVVIVCFLANASVLLPSSSILIVIEYSMIINPTLVAVCGAFGSALGEMTGFCIGRFGRRAIPGKLKKWLYARMLNHMYLFVFLFSVIPLPIFDIVGMLSGAMKMNAIRFYVICFLGKLIKMLCYIWLAQELYTLMR